MQILAGSCSTHRRWSLLAAVACFIAVEAISPPIADAAVYRGRDKNGNIIYSDRPFDGAKEMDAPPLPRYTPSTPSTSPADDTAKEGSTSQTTPSSGEEERPAGYARVAIVQPRHDENIHDNEGNVAVTVELTPGLNKNHRLVVVIDGTRGDTLWNTPSMAIHNIDRGTHQLAIEIVDTRTRQVVGKSREIVFHMHRASALFRRK